MKSRMNENIMDKPQDATKNSDHPVALRIDYSFRILKGEADVASCKRQCNSVDVLDCQSVSRSVRQSDLGLTGQLIDRYDRLTDQLIH